MNYQAALAKMLSLMESRQTSPSGGPVPYELHRIRALLNRLGNPHLKVPAVHVAGTKGKGSVTAMLSAILTAAGCKTGSFTSPHLTTFRERLRINQEPVSEALFAHILEEIWPAVEDIQEQPGLSGISVFELLTAMAFVCFAELGCAAQVIEVGLGGRLDCTNLLEHPLVSVITSISIDHQEILGPTLGDIAREKAGILKAGCPCVCAPQNAEAVAVIRQVAQSQQAPLVEVDRRYQWERGAFSLAGQAFCIRSAEGTLDAWMPLLGRHQLENAVCTLATCHLLRQQGLPVPDSAIQEGFRNVSWPGRLEVLQQSPLLVVDGAHNPFSARRLREAVEEYLQRKRAILILGVAADKDLEGIAAELAPIAAHVLACRSRHLRSRASGDIARAFQALQVPVREFAAVGEATKAALALAQRDDLILGTGSLFTAGEIREQVLDIPPEIYPMLKSAAVPPAGP